MSYPKMQLEFSENYREEGYFLLAIHTVGICPDLSGSVVKI